MAPRYSRRTDSGSRFLLLMRCQALNAEHSGLPMGSKHRSLTLNTAASRPAQLRALAVLGVVPQHFSLELEMLPELDVESSELLGLTFGQEIISMDNQVDSPVLTPQAAGARCPLDETEALQCSGVRVGPIERGVPRPISSAHICSSPSSLSSSGRATNTWRVYGA